MKKTELKKELHEAIESIDDESFLQAIYTIVNQHIPSHSYNLLKEDWAEIEHIQKEYKKGKIKTYTLAEVKKYSRSKAKK